jgi:hypothetical protein
MEIGCVSFAVFLGGGFVGNFFTWLIGHVCAAVVWSFGLRGQDNSYASIDGIFWNMDQVQQKTLIMDNTYIRTC